MSNGDGANEAGPERNAQTYRHEIRLTTIELNALLDSYPGARSISDALRLAVRDSIEITGDEEQE